MSQVGCDGVGGDHTRSTKTWFVSYTEKEGELMRNVKKREDEAGGKLNEDLINDDPTARTTYGNP